MKECWVWGIEEESRKVTTWHINKKYLYIYATHIKPLFRVLYRKELCINVG